MRGVAVCLCSTLLVLVTGGEGFWLSLPFALLLASWAPNHAGAVLPASVVTILAIAAARGGSPPLLLILVVVGGSVAVVRLLEESFARERRALRATAMRDPLTGAANRRAFGERLRYEIARHTRQQRRFAVIALDLDGFKAVNDRFGHQAGDELLKQVAEALMIAVREQDTVARVGGDEFYVLAPETDRVGGERLEARVRSAIAGVTTGLDSLSASVGFALFPEDAEDPATLVEVADAAAMVAKREHKLESQAA